MWVILFDISWPGHTMGKVKHLRCIEQVALSFLKKHLVYWWGFYNSVQWVLSSCILVYVVFAVQDLAYLMVILGGILIWYEKGGNFSLIWNKMLILMNNVLWLVLYPCIKYVLFLVNDIKFMLGFLTLHFLGFVYLIMIGVIYFGYWGHVFVKQVIFIPCRDGPGPWSPWLLPP